MSVLNITDNAVKELHRFKKESSLNDVVVRVAVEGGGCSGFNYKIDFENETNIKVEDDVFEKGGIKFVVDKKSALFIAGTTLDWHEELSKRGFTFENPNATKSCGCGSSFSV